MTSRISLTLLLTLFFSCVQNSTPALDNSRTLPIIEKTVESLRDGSALKKITFTTNKLRKSVPAFCQAQFKKWGLGLAFLYSAYQFDPAFAQQALALYCSALPLNYSRGFGLLIWHEFGHWLSNYLQYGTKTTIALGSDEWGLCSLFPHIKVGNILRLEGYTETTASFRLSNNEHASLMARLPLADYEELSDEEFFSKLETVTKKALVSKQIKYSITALAGPLSAIAANCYYKSCLGIPPTVIDHHDMAHLFNLMPYPGSDGEKLFIPWTNKSPHLPGRKLLQQLALLLLTYAAVQELATSEIAPWLFAFGITLLNLAMPYPIFSIE